VISIKTVLVKNKKSLSMRIPITIADYVKHHLENNPNENEKVVRVRIEVLENDSPRQGQKI